MIENAALIGKDEEAPVTEIEKAAIALTAIGIDASNFDDNGEKINFIQQIADNEGLDLLINAQIFALIAVDSGNYNTPEGGRTKETLIQSILDKKCDGGGWAFSGDVADPDLTGMAILALAPYYESDVNVKNSLDEAVNILSNMQLEDGGFESYGTKNSISTATVLSALTAFGINPYSDQRFIKNGNHGNRSTYVVLYTRYRIWA